MTRRPAATRATIESPGAWLTRVAGRICLDLPGSARIRRERYVGEWVPEPLPDRRERGGEPDPADRVTLDESVTMAFLVVLEQMTPAERVSFVLHDVFRYPFAEIADIVGIGKVAPDLTVLARTVNGRPGLVATYDGVAVTVAAFQVGNDRITRIWAVRNPDKLKPWRTAGRG